MNIQEECGQCGGEKWKRGQCTIHDRNEYVFVVLICVKCGNVLFFTEDTA